MLSHAPRPLHLPTWLAALLLLAFLVGAAPAAHADLSDAVLRNADKGGGKASWAVQPGGSDAGTARSNFVYTLRPGTVLRDYVNVLNTGKKPVRLDLYAVDAFNVAKGGGFALHDPEEARTGVGGWVRLARTIPNTVMPGKGMRIPFEIVVPENAEPGDHAGAVVAANRQLEKANAKGDLLYQVRRRVGARIYVRVEGPLDPGLTVSQFDVTSETPLIPYATGRGQVSVDWSVTNNGNVRIDPQAVVELVGPFGGVLDEVEVEIPEILPGSIVTGTSVFDELPPYVKLSARMKVTSDEADADVSRTVWSVPWLPMLVLVLLAVTWWLRRRHRKDRWPFGRRTAAEVDSETEAEPISVP